MYWFKAPVLSGKIIAFCVIPASKEGEGKGSVTIDFSEFSHSVLSFVSIEMSNMFYKTSRVYMVNPFENVKHNTI